MRTTTRMARDIRDVLERWAHVSTDGVVVSISKRHRFPQCDGAGKITLPACLLDDDMTGAFKRTWRHELQHARDAVDGLLDTLTRDEAERRARWAETNPIVLYQSPNNLYSTAPSATGDA